MRGQPEHNTRPHVRLPPSFLGMNAWMTSQLNVALIHKLRGSSICLAYFLTCYPWMLYNQALVDVRSTGAGIKCLYCIACTPAHNTIYCTTATGAATVIHHTLLYSAFNPYFPYIGDKK